MSTEAAKNIGLFGKWLATPRLHWSWESVLGILVPLLFTCIQLLCATRRLNDLAFRSLSADDRTIEHLDLNVFPALTHIDIDHGPRPVLSRVLSRLAPGNRLGAIRLLLRGDMNHVNNQEAEIFESAILGISVPALRRVEVKVRRGPSLVSTPETDLVRTIETALPRLREKGLIFTVIE
ncbi:hypothetical protein B0H13DRAFT_1914997 [Mycena leptocephala]|nr:hypothetical protein B0H13DRAFT_1914997 [Mycena leptocephala]